MIRAKRILKAIREFVDSKGTYTKPNQDDPDQGPGSGDTTAPPRPPRTRRRGDDDEPLGYWECDFGFFVDPGYLPGTVPKSDKKHNAPMYLVAWKQDWGSDPEAEEGRVIPDSFPTTTDDLTDWLEDYLVEGDFKELRLHTETTPAPTEQEITDLWHWAEEHGGEMKLITTPPNTLGRETFRQHAKSSSMLTLANPRKTATTPPWKPRSDYRMYTPAGDQVVASMVRAVRSMGLTSGEDVLHELRTRMDTIALQHPEVWDTDVREQIAEQFADFIPEGQLYASWLN